MLVKFDDPPVGQKHTGDLANDVISLTGNYACFKSVFLQVNDSRF